MNPISFRGEMPNHLKTGEKNMHVSDSLPKVDMVLSNTGDKYEKPQWPNLEQRSSLDFKAEMARLYKEVSAQMVTTMRRR